LWSGASGTLESDPCFGAWVRRIGPTTASRADLHPFAYLVRAIVGQQLAGAAAATIHGRVVDELDGDVVPESVGRADPARLRAAGLSASKLRAIRDLADRAASGALLLEEDHLAPMDDETIVTHLTGVWGVGRWTAQMFLMFRLGRPDVWPTGDLGVRAGWARIYRVERPSAKALETAADHLRPWRSAAAWYCWRAIELPDPDPEATR
jgi:3-methyladenine DNA glycosylase/8-oxoguanine DNA glycosylase